MESTSTSTSKPLPKKRKVEQNKPNKTEELLDKAITYLDKGKQKKVEDAEDNFSNHLACQLRELPVRERNYVKFKIQEVIYNVQFFGIGFQQAPQHGGRPLHQLGNRTPLPQSGQGESSFTTLLSPPDSLSAPISGFTSRQSFPGSPDFSQHGF